MKTASLLMTLQARSFVNSAVITTGEKRFEAEKLYGYAVHTTAEEKPIVLHNRYRKVF